MVDHNDDTFIRITNKEIYGIVKDLKDSTTDQTNQIIHQQVKTNEHLKGLNGNVKFNRRWLFKLTCGFATAFLFLLSLIWAVKGGVH